MKTTREELLQRLESIGPGVDKKATIEQSDCYVFTEDGWMQTFNDEIAASIKSPFKGIEGAVKADPLVNLLRKFTEDQVNCDVKDGRFVVTIPGKRKRAQIQMEEEILLPVDSIDFPEDDQWKPLPEDFCDAVQVVQGCAGKDESHFVLTCVHLHPEWVEACDNMQVTRYPLETGVEEPCLIRRDSIKHVAQLGVTSFAETESWIHFRNDSGLTLSCRRYAEEYPALDGVLEVDGEKTSLPGGLAEAVDKAIIFSADNPDDNQVEISLKGGKLKARGSGASGSYEEIKDTKYEGPPLSFMIDPKLLIELTKRTSECEISGEKLKIDGGSFSYVACLS